MSTDGMVDLSMVRATAAAWHGGAASPLCALATSGAILDGCADEVRECIAQAESLAHLLGFDTAADIPALRHLLVYVEHHGPRDAVAGWSEIRF